jgi:hypothetical protein
MAKQKDRRLTDLLNVELARVSSLITVAKRSPDQCAALLTDAEVALEGAQEILGRITRAAEAI